MIKHYIKIIKSTVFPTDYDLTIKKWFLDNGDLTHRLDYDLNKESQVIDLGGYKGQWASDIFSKYLCHVIVFEPVNEFALDIMKRFQKNKNIEVFKLGLGASTRIDKISVCADGSSLYKKSSEMESIQIVDVKNWFEEYGINNVDLIKINIEGGEYELLERLISSGLIRSIKNIQVQFHNIFPDSESRMQKIQKKLEKTHHITYQYNFVWENWSINDDELTTKN